MQVNNVFSRNIIVNGANKTNSVSAVNFSDALLAKMSTARDSYIKSERETAYYSGTYNGILNNVSLQKGQQYSGTIKSVETERYTIEETEYGDLRIYDKERKEGFIWELGKNQVQVDAETGTKLLINDWGSGFFNMVAVDAELENALKEALGVDELAEKELEGFTVNQDEKTGIKYVTANGYESQGGLIVFDDETGEKLDSLAQEYLSKYPNLVKDYNEAWFYATFEVRGLAKQTANGILMIGPNCITFKHMDGENRWVSIFNPENWKDVKAQFDSNVGKDLESWDFWYKFFKDLDIDASLVTPGTYVSNNGYDKAEKSANSDFERFMALCFS